MTRKRLTIFLILLPLIGLPLLALLASGCGFVTMPISTTKAIVANTQHIKIDAAILDESGQPLDDVTVVVTRLSEHPEFYLIWSAAVVSSDKPEAPRLVSRNFTYESHGKCAVEVTFTKPGYQPYTAYYANRIGQGYYAWTNVSQNRTVTVTLHKGSATGPSPRLYLNQ